MTPLAGWIVCRGADGYLWTLAASELASRALMAKTWGGNLRVEQHGYTVKPVVITEASPA